MVRTAITNLLLTAVSIALVLVALEVGVRVIPNHWRDAFEYYASDRTTVRYRPDGDDLYGLAPDAAARFHRPCFETHDVVVNDHGLRGPWPAGQGGVAVLGDSFVEALQVGDGDTMSAQLAGLLGVPVRNFGVSGFSTLDELTAWRRWVRPTRPSQAVLMVYLGNDIDGNACVLSSKFGRCARPAADGGIVVEGTVAGTASQRDGTAPVAAAAADGGSASPDAKGDSASPDAKGWARRNLVVYQLLHDAKVVVASTLARLSGEVPEQRRLYLGEDAAWSEAWEVTRRILAQMAAEMAADKVRLLVVGIPEHFVTSPTGRRELELAGGTALPADFDPNRPMRRLEAVARGLGLDFLDLTPAMVAYRDAHRLPAPAFSFRCDGHWNPLGHRVAAAAVATALGHAPPAGWLAADPRTVLGDQGWRAIFERGVYQGGRP
ncbi:MAG: alginate O-acetyltransferase AlgX-related protein [Actinomycetota bacterium]